MEKFSVENITAKLSKIKEVLLNDETQETEEVQLEDVRMVDGTILRIEPAIEVGATVQVIGEDGKLIDAPDGQLELEDGRVISVEGGVLAEIQEVEGEEEVVEEEMSEQEEVIEEAPQANSLDVEALQNQLIQRLNDAITEKIEKLRFAKEDEVASLKEENKELKSTLIEVVEMFETFANAEVAKPKKSPSKAWMSKEDTKVDYSKLFKKK